jgi:hypothetical protein
MIIIRALITIISTENDTFRAIITTLSIEIDVHP